MEHPTPSEIDFFLDGSLPRERARAVLLHLLRGCEPCRAAMGPKVDSLFQLDLEGHGLAKIAPEDLVRLGLALEQVTPQRPRNKMLRRKRPGGGTAILARLASAGVGDRGGHGAAVASPRAGAHAVYEALLARSWALYQEDPRKMVEYAWYATRAALCLQQEGFPAEEVAGLHARALGELANAYRLAERLGEAEKTLAEAEAMAAGAGGGAADPFVALRLVEIRAGLLCSRHQYKAAFDLLDRLLEGYERSGERHAAGRILIQQGLCQGYLGDSPEETQEALLRLEDGLLRVDPEMDPPLRLTAIHGQLRLLVAGGRLEEALVRLVQHREELQRPERRLDRARLASIEGRVQAGLGHFHLAEGALREARDAFEELDSKANWAVACLDLAAVLAACQPAGPAGSGGNEARALAEEALWAFRHLPIGDGVLEALGILDQVLQAEILAPGFLRHLAAFVRRAEHDPAARFVPSFE
jgi:hypothetical protein